VTVSGRILSTSDGTNREAFTPFDWVLFLSISTIWGSSFLLMDVGLDALEPGLITLMRVILGATVLLVVPRARRPIERADVPRLVALSITWVAIPMTLIPIAQQHINSAVTGMLNGATPIFTAAIASVMLRSLPRRTQAVGLLIGFAGVAVISVASGAEGSTSVFGVLLVVLSTSSYGLSITISIPLSQRYGALAVMMRMLVIGIVWTLPLGVRDLAGSRFEWAPVVAVAVAGVIGTGLAFVVMGTLVGRVGSTRGSFINYLIPVVAIAFGVGFRGDRVTTAGLMGAALVIGGALLASRREDPASSNGPE
jgi:drug/metabolite transporter (DMT)-like permease